MAGGQETGRTLWGAGAGAGRGGDGASSQSVGRLTDQAAGVNGLYDCNTW